MIEQSQQEKIEAAIRDGLAAHLDVSTALLELEFDEIPDDIYELDANHRDFWRRVFPVMMSFVQFKKLNFDEKTLAMYYAIPGVLIEQKPFFDQWPYNDKRRRRTQ